MGPSELHGLFTFLMSGVVPVIVFLYGFRLLLRVTRALERTANALEGLTDRNND